MSARSWPASSRSGRLLTNTWPRNSTPARLPNDLGLSNKNTPPCPADLCAPFWILPRSTSSSPPSEPSSVASSPQTAPLDNFASPVSSAATSPGDSQDPPPFFDKVQYAAEGYLKTVVPKALLVWMQTHPEQWSPQCLKYNASLCVSCQPTSNVIAPHLWSSYLRVLTSNPLKQEALVWLDGLVTQTNRPVMVVYTALLSPSPPYSTSFLDSNKASNSGFRTSPVPEESPVHHLIKHTSDVAITADGSITSSLTLLIDKSQLDHGTVNFTFDNEVSGRDAKGNAMPTFGGSIVVRASDACRSFRCDYDGPAPSLTLGTSMLQTRSFTANIGGGMQGPEAGLASSLSHQSGQEATFSNVPMVQSYHTTGGIRWNRFAVVVDGSRVDPLGLHASNVATVRPSYAGGFFTRVDAPLDLPWLSIESQMEWPKRTADPRLLVSMWTLHRMSVPELLESSDTEVLAVPSASAWQVTHSAGNSNTTIGTASVERSIRRRTLWTKASNLFRTKANKIPRLVYGSPSLILGKFCETNGFDVQEYDATLSPTGLDMREAITDFYHPPSPRMQSPAFPTHGN